LLRELLVKNIPAADKYSVKKQIKEVTGTTRAAIALSDDLLRSNGISASESFTETLSAGRLPPL